MELPVLSYFNSQYLIDDRNEENYSFDGYGSLDFNLPSNLFMDYFEQDYVKEKSDTIYDLDSGGVFEAFSRQYNLYAKMQIEGLPIEHEKFAQMIDYCLPVSEIKNKLLDLCENGFPTKGLRSHDGDIFYDDQNKSL